MAGSSLPTPNLATADGPTSINAVLSRAWARCRRGPERLGKDSRWEVKSVGAVSGSAPTSALSQATALHLILCFLQGNPPWHQHSWRSCTESPWGFGLVPVPIPREPPPCHSGGPIAEQLGCDLERDQKEALLKKKKIQSNISAASYQYLVWNSVNTDASTVLFVCTKRMVIWVIQQEMNSP